MDGEAVRLNRDAKPPKKRPRANAEAIVRLEDLAPRKDPTGGSGKVLFGEEGRRPADGRQGESRPGSKS
jgi:hypothetical protein